MLACKEAGTVSADKSIGRISNLKTLNITYVMACWVWDNLLLWVKFLFELDSVFKDMSTMEERKAHIFLYPNVYVQMYMFGNFLKEKRWFKGYFKKFLM
jgi:hypothetical protein